MTVAIESIEKLRRDIREASTEIGIDEARFLVDAHYQIQDHRIHAESQVRSLSSSEEPHAILDWLFEQNRLLENEIKKVLDRYSDGQLLGRWAKCAPPGAEVLVEGGRGRRGRRGGTVPIETLSNGSRVVAFDRRRARMTDPVPVSVGVAHYEGEMLRVITDAGETRVTPAHKWLVRLEAPVEACVVYLMRRGRKFRVGVTQAIKPELGRGGRFGVRVRARQERADDAWVLKFCPSRREAFIYEAFVSAQYGLPTTVFRSVAGGAQGFWGDDEIEAMFGMLDPTEQWIRAMRCIADHGLSPETPVIHDVGYGTKETVAGIVCHAINLVPGMMRIPVPLVRGGIEWRELIAVEKEAYSGPVYSLNVPGHHAYVQDGLATRNSIIGIGPVLTAGLLAHIDITRAPTVGHIYSFAGLNPEAVWEKGKKRPWNADLRCLCWKAGESFIKVQANPRDVYGKLYAERKAKEINSNELGFFADQAAKVLESKRLGKDTQARGWYEKGMLPPAHIHARARRFAVKLFLSHYHEVGYFIEYGELPAKPYAIEQLGHAHILPVPNAELIPGLVEAQAKRGPRPS